RAVGVATSEGELRGERVFLCAGAYGSPGILLRSGVGPERGLPVGEGLLDHVGVGLGFEVTDRLQPQIPAFDPQHPRALGQISVERRSSTCEEGVWALFPFPAIAPPVDGVYEISAGAFAMKPRSRGSVRLTSPDPRAPLAIDHGFLSDPRDAGVVAEGV